MDIQIFNGIRGPYLNVQANAGYDDAARKQYREHLANFIDAGGDVKLAKVEIAMDIPVMIDEIVVVPVHHRFCPKLGENGFPCDDSYLAENGCYFGARSSNTVFALYDRAARLKVKYPYYRDNFLTRIEARVRPRVPLNEAVSLSCVLSEKIAIYYAPARESFMSFLPTAWWHADTRARKRFIEKMAVFQIHPNEKKIQEELSKLPNYAMPFG